MNKLIICEGATDAILLSYYLEKMAGWVHCKKPPKDLVHKEETIEESINWYEKNSDNEQIKSVPWKESEILKQCFSELVKI